MMLGKYQVNVQHCRWFTSHKVRNVFGKSIKATTAQYVISGFSQHHHGNFVLNLRNFL